MVNYRNVTIAVVGLFLSVSFFASTVVAAEKDGIMMKNGRIQKLQEGKDIGPMDRMTTMANGTKVMMNGKIMTKDGQQPQLDKQSKLPLPFLLSSSVEEDYCKPLLLDHEWPSFYRICLTRCAARY